MTPDPESAGAPAPARPGSSLPILAPRFPMGQIVATPGALALLKTHGVSAWALLRRHQVLGPGELGLADQQANQADLAASGRIFSKYAVVPGQCVYVITEADRSVTTVLLPEEY
ncbi:MAG: hypothetical protein RL722_2000 [Pseudomonadota bacterium]|jgi:hypothetical protein